VTGDRLTPTPALPNLHDAVLENVEINWQDAAATVRLTLVPGPPATVALEAEGLREVHLSHDQPWGPSIYVNGAEYVQVVGADEVTLRIQMQSGDDIKLRARSFAIA
jgi:hypothetical protein